MYHSEIPQHNKDVIIKSSTEREGLVFATMALGMGVDFVALTRTIHYCAPRCIDDYFQKSSRAGRGGEPLTSTIILAALGCSSLQESLITKGAEVAAVRRYIENTQVC